MDWETELRASGCSAIDEEAFAVHLDRCDPLAHIRTEFEIPDARSTGNSHSKEAVYLCGNSLGLMPTRTKALVNQELQVWAERGVQGHFDHPHGRPWVSIDDHVVGSMAKIVGAQSSEVAVCGTLTGNLHSMLATFYQPRDKRTKIFFEDKAFPSDYYAIESQIKLKGLDPESNILLAKTRLGEYTLRTADIIQTIEEHGTEIAVVLFSGVQYYTGQFFDMESITRAAQRQGCIVGWNLAHAVGNVPLQLHDWNVDFAVWCTYKYLNAGPGAIAGLFIHQRLGDDLSRPREAGWWGHDRKSRFDMALQFNPIPGAQGYQVSNPSVFSLIPLLGSLQVFDQTDMIAVSEKSRRLTGYLEKLLGSALIPDKTIFQIITPSDPRQRGAQLSLIFAESSKMTLVAQSLQKSGIIIDERKPNVIRISPAPLYNRYSEVLYCVKRLAAIIAQATTVG